MVKLHTIANGCVYGIVKEQNKRRRGRRAKQTEDHTMPEKTEAQKRAQKAYMDKYALITIRMKPEEKEAVSAHASAQGESVNNFVKRAIKETMERETE